MSADDTLALDADFRARVIKLLLLPESLLSPALSRFSHVSSAPNLLHVAELLLQAQPRHINYYKSFSRSWQNSMRGTWLLFAAEAPPWGPVVSRRWKHWCVPFIFMSEVCMSLCVCVSVGLCLFLFVCLRVCVLCSVDACVRVWCVLLIDVLTTQSSSNLSEEEEAACSDLRRAQKLQMSGTRTVSGSWISFSFSLLFYTWACRHSGKEQILYFRTQISITTEWKSEWMTLKRENVRKKM